jgi:hypothetical protein
MTAFLTAHAETLAGSLVFIAYLILLAVAILWLERHARETGGAGGARPARHTRALHGRAPSSVRGS